MSAQRLRDAAKVLRRAADGTTWHPACGGWWSVGMETNAVAEADVGIATACSPEVARFIATMHPGVALLMANVIESCAYIKEHHANGLFDVGSGCQVEHLADLILGADS